MLAVVIDVAIAVVWLFKGFTPENAIFFGMHAVVSSLSILYYVSSDIKTNETYVSVAKAISTLSLISLACNLLALCFPAYVDQDSVLSAFLLMTGPAGLASATLLILFQIDVTEIKSEPMYYQYIPQLVPKTSQFIKRVEV